MDLTEFRDEDLGPGGAFVTPMGADPTTVISAARHPHGAPSGGTEADYAAWPHPRHGVFMPFGAFRDLRREEGDPNRAQFVPTVRIPVSAGADRSVAAEMLDAGLVSYIPRFDAEVEEWFVEMELAEPLMPVPFLRLGLVRYQPDTKPGLQVSRPAAVWIQIQPRRVFDVTEMADTVRAVLRGVASYDKPGLGSGASDDPLTDGDLAVARPLATFRMVEEWTDEYGLLHRSPVSDPNDDPVAARYNSAEAFWSAEFPQRPAPARPGGRIVLTVEETARDRPASYASEPIDPLDPRTDATEVTGPRFHAEVTLGSNTRDD